MEATNPDARNEMGIENGTSMAEVAFTDPRRFGRVRLLNCDKEDIRKISPLKENGPDPIIDKSILSLEWLQSKLNCKHVHIKSFLLDQANISGIGNWVGDEILYNAKIHPEQYSDTLSVEQIKVLHHCIMYVCETAVGVLADSEKFPSDWLFNYRWGKAMLTKTAKKRKNSEDSKEPTHEDPKCLPNGTKISFVTVGGRTSCFVPSLQQKKLQDKLSNDYDEENENLSENRLRKRVKKDEETLEIDKNKRTLRSVKI
ncbi:putative formamidopyrimidine-dna glycosylase [Erysiphe necator]|uniref:Putative formamidopyrimidine-dna glycosylase n=1 Tax=Uncinula necator TaxID=52586 RepID=A0A0B1PB88_UNCNE|nr:putative formamidopyrimidine-dna glycosylase [Erysiphe necator]